jgi:hypothetical protein
VANLWERAVGANVRSKIDYRGPLGTLPARDEILVAATAIYLKGYSWDEAKQLAQKAYADADESMKVYCNIQPDRGSWLPENWRKVVL